MRRALGLPVDGDPLGGRDALSFAKLQWLFPIAVALHNGEEALTMPGWGARHASQLPVPAPGAATIRVTLLVLTLAAFAVTWLSTRRGKRSFAAYLLFGSIIAMLANVFVPHVPAALILRAYTPGLATAVLINLPLMTWLAVAAVRERWVSGAKAVAFAVAVPMALAGLVALLFAVSRIL